MVFYHFYGMVLGGARSVRCQVGCEVSSFLCIVSKRSSTRDAFLDLAFGWQFICELEVHLGIVAANYSLLLHDRGWSTAWLQIFRKRNSVPLFHSMSCKPTVWIIFRVEKVNHWCAVWGYWASLSFTGFCLKSRANGLGPLEWNAHARFFNSISRHECVCMGHRP